MKLLISALAFMAGIAQAQPGALMENKTPESLYTTVSVAACALQRDGYTESYTVSQFAHTGHTGLDYGTLQKAVHDGFAFSARWRDYTCDQIWVAAIDGLVIQRKM